MNKIISLTKTRLAQGPKERRFQPEFVLIRQKPITDHDRNILLG